MTSHATSLQSPPARGPREGGTDPSSTGSPAQESDDLREGLLVSGVTKRWGDRSVLEEADFEVRPGACAWLGGRNGVGKTTLLRIIAGLITADQGEVSLEGLRPHRDRRAYQARVGFLSAGDRGLYARLSVRQNLDLWARLALLPRGAAEEALRRSISMFGLNELADARVDRLSLGQRQRVRLAMAFLHSPHLVLLDEPANSLDDDGLALIAAAVTELNQAGGMAIWCSPNRPDLEQLSAGYVLSDGHLSEDG
jgi:ABC-2 type transport system ATP-binding protein